ncbi:hypothetical protein V1294_006068 [Bradyrhizobium sp. AZCC 1678]
MIRACATVSRKNCYRQHLQNEGDNAEKSAKSDQPLFHIRTTCSAGARARDTPRSVEHSLARFADATEQPHQRRYGPKQLLSVVLRGRISAAPGFRSKWHLALPPMRTPPYAERGVGNRRQIVIVSGQIGLPSHAKTKKTRSFNAFLPRFAGSFPLRRAKRLRKGAKRRSNPSLRLSHYGLLRFARNDAVRAPR